MTMKKSKSYSNEEEKQKEQILDKENNYNNYINCIIFKAWRK
jgi:hypothetical protein